MENFANVLRNAPSFVEFLSSGTKQISEYDYINLRNTCITEVFNQYTPKSVSDALSYFRPRQNAFKQIVEECGDRKSTRLNSSHIPLSRMPSSA